ncbi:MAG: hypothetical protein Q8P25_04565, partial [Candidatus Curtissbacteria bacterium]|nr:hypothetical protein [Candidatus Curtissbacteria bacterium]
MPGSPDRNPYRLKIPKERDVQKAHYAPPVRVVGQRRSSGISRREAFTLAGGALVTALLGKVAVDAWKEAADSLNKDKEPTQEQKNAAQLLEIVSKNDRVYNLVAVGEKSGDKIIPVNLRDKPATEGDIPKPDWSGEVIGTLPVGTRISEAVAVYGNNPKIPWQKDGEGRWLAFFDPANPQRAVFAY